MLETGCACVEKLVAVTEATNWRVLRLGTGGLPKKGYVVS